MWPLLELKARAPWRRQISVSPCEEPRGVTPDIVIHLGGHICLNRHIMLASSLWNQHETSRGRRKDAKRLENTIKELFRSVFRERFSSVDMQWIMTNCSNYMIWTERDVGDVSSTPSQVLQLAAEVANEYISAFQGKDEIHHVHDIGRSACVVTLDTNSECLPLKPGWGGCSKYPDAPMLAPKHWSLLKQAMERDDLQNLVVATSRPLLRGTPRESRRAGEIDTRAAEGWSRKEDELKRLLIMLFEWQNKGGRQVVLLCDSRPGNLGYLTEVLDLSRSDDDGDDDLRAGRIAQIVVSPCDPWYEMGDHCEEERRDYDEKRTEEDEEKTRTETDKIKDISYVLVPKDGTIANRFYFRNRARTRLGHCTVGLVRLMCCREINSSKNETFLKKESILGAELSLVEAVTSSSSSLPIPLAKMILGPILGRVTSHSVVILIEVDTNATVTCILQNKRYELREESSVRCPSQRPKSFVFDNLRENCTLQWSEAFIFSLFLSLHLCLSLSISSSLSLSPSFNVTISLPLSLFRYV